MAGTDFETLGYVLLKPFRLLVDRLANPAQAWFRSALTHETLTTRSQTLTVMAYCELDRINSSLLPSHSRAIQ